MKQRVRHCALYIPSRKKCKVLKLSCKFEGADSRCAFSKDYHWLKDVTKDPKVTKRIKEKILNTVCKNWKKYFEEYFKSGKLGCKNMTGGPLEKEIRNILRSELKNTKAKVCETAKELKGYHCIVDVYIQKRGKPKTIISVKSGGGPEAIRETFGYAYLLKKKRRKIKIYMVILPPIKEKHKELIKYYKKYIDGVFSLSGKPYFDDLVHELKRIYL